ncbi:MAG: right-handed parallel beta-helix repeat-containing protein [Candidatus Babeliales bacterium]
MNLRLMMLLVLAAGSSLLASTCCKNNSVQSQLGCINSEIQQILNKVIDIHVIQNDGCHLNIVHIKQVDIPYTIFESGHYCLQEDVIAAGANAITITASNVTLDLNGFHITGGTNGITSSGTDVKIFNGTVQGATTSGIAITGGTNIVIDNVVARTNGADGFFSSGGSTVQFNNVEATQNGADGFHLTVSNYDLNHVVANQNLGGGVFATGNALTIHTSHFEQNEEGGIFLGSLTNFCIENSTIQRNTGNGIEVTGTSNTGLLFNNCITSNTAIGIILADATEYVEIIQNKVIGNGPLVVSTAGIDIGGGTWLNSSPAGGIATTHAVFANFSQHNGTTPGTAAATDTNYSQNLKALTTTFGELRTTLGTGIGRLENITL